MLLIVGLIVGVFIGLVIAAFLVMAKSERG